MKRIILLIFFFITLFSSGSFSQHKPGSRLSYEGYKFDTRIRGPRGKKVKVLEIMIDEHGYYFVAKYKTKGKDLLIIIYEMYTWNKVLEFKTRGLAELYNSYFSSDGSTFYVNTDIYKQKYLKVDVETGEQEQVECEETPKGCRYLERQRPITGLYTADENYMIFRDKKRKKNIKVYVNKEIKKMMEYMSDEEVQFTQVEDEIRELSENTLDKVLDGEKVVYGGIRYQLGKAEDNETDEKPHEVYEIFFTPEYIQQLKAGETIELKGIKIKMETD